MYISFISSQAAVFIVTALILRFLIPKLKSLKMGQKILDIGPRWHKSKEGTPTMGGISFIIAITAAVAVYVAVKLFGGCDIKDQLPLIFTFGLALLNGLIGIFDDSVKLTKKQNEGISASQKLILQILVAAIYLVGMRAFGFISTALYLPFIGIELELGIFYYIFAIVLIVGIVNSANLTDGIDGLVSSVSHIIMAFFAFCAFRLGSEGLGVISGAAMGGCLGFLVYNSHPARVFMGDTGSLFLGGMTVGAAFMMGSPLIIVLAGLIFIIEAMSDIIQVLYYKKTKKRFFKMAPIHHHFEKCGWSEVKVVTVFTLFTLVMCLIAAFSIII
ncbi:MAG: phospho-N-acetylmuramoyl-pentapeptide-transferase [Clostridia bacterium]|nr:phospho-N-acetylmuramoyl-pentapeptide-transferase [Clostridia bacterium]